MNAEGGAVETRIASRDQFFNALFVQEFEALRRFAYLLLLDPDGADDVAMEAFARALPKWRRVSSLDWPAGYLRKTVVNLARSRYRKQRVFESVTHLISMSDAVEQDHSSFDFRNRVAALPFRQRACLTLHYMEGFSDSEIGRILDCPVGTVKSQLARARETLLKRMSEEERR